MRTFLTSARRPWDFYEREHFEEKSTLVYIYICREIDILKGLGHAILGNFSTDRMVIELTKISK